MIRWIRDYIGTAPWEFAKNTPDVEILDVRDLVDGAGNSAKLIEEKINSGVESIQKNKKLVVCCEYGMSRSNAIAVGILSKIEKITFNQSLKIVIDLTKEDQIKLSILKSIKEIVKQKSLKEKKSDKILIIDHENYIGREFSVHLNPEKFVLLSREHHFSELINNTALLYLLVSENHIGRVLFVSCDGVINTNEFIGRILHCVKNILDVCSEADCSLFFISTLDVFLGYRSRELNVKSSSIKKPRGNRGIAYAFAEDLIRDYKRNYKVNAAIVRIPVVYGKHNLKPYFIANFIRKAKLNVEIKIHEYKNNLAWVNLIHVNDLTRFIFQLLRKNKFDTYNIDGGEQLNTSDISREIIKIYSSSSVITLVPLEINHVKINIELGKIKEKFGWKPQENFYKTIKKQQHANTSN